MSNLDYPYANKKQKSRAVVSLVLGIISLFVLPFLSVAGLVSGIIALKDMSNGVPGNKAMAICGVVLSAIALVLWIVTLSV